MIFRMIPIFALVSILGLAACQEEGGDAGGTETESGTTEETGTQ
ncbi:hypothetical protein [Palleronia pontilimi]|nr:hypothetical protein [Palleronia pontilimi]